jgi:hypothetical protein
MEKSVWSELERNKACQTIVFLAIFAAYFNESKDTEYIYKNRTYKKNGAR